MDNSESYKHNLPLVARLPVYYGWVILPIASLALFISGPGQTYTISVFVDPIIEDTGLSRTTVSLLYTLGSLTAAVAMVAVGYLFDRLGARLMLLLVGLCFGLAALWMSEADNSTGLYVGFAALRTFGQGALSLIPTALVAIWFVRRRGKATAIVSLGSAAGQATLPPVSHMLINHLGWRNTWVFYSLMIWGVLLLPVAILVRRSPESIGLLVDGDTNEDKDSRRAHIPYSQREPDWSLREAAHTPTFWWLLLAGSSQSFISTALVFHQVSLFADKGLDSGVAALALTVTALTSLAFAFLAGFLSDKFPDRYILASAQIIIILSLLSTMLISNTWESFVYAALLGMGSGLMMTVSTVIWPNYFGRQHIGSIRGIHTTSMVAFAALGPFLFGILFDITHTYTIPVIVFLTLPCLSTIAAFLAKPPIKL